MGIGDEIMVSGEVKRLQPKDGTVRRFAVIDKRAGITKWRWEDIWDGNPLIAKPGTPYDETYENRGGMRPYIVEKSAHRWVWKPYMPTPGDIYLRDTDKYLQANGLGCVVIQPGVKYGASPNKQWGEKHWHRLVRENPDVKWLQLLDGTCEPVPGATVLQTPSFRQACAVLSVARAAVLHEGGLHHAAAALGVRSVVLYGGFISPACTGYDMHVNLFAESTDHPLGCGMRGRCLHCEMAMRGFTTQRVMRELQQLL